MDAGVLADMMGWDGDLYGMEICMGGKGEGGKGYEGYFQGGGYRKL